MKTIFLSSFWLLSFAFSGCGSFPQDSKPFGGVSIGDRRAPHLLLIQFSGIPEDIQSELPFVFKNALDNLPRLRGKSPFKIKTSNTPGSAGILYCISPAKGQDSYELLRQFEGMDFSGLTAKISVEYKCEFMQKKSPM